MDTTINLKIGDILVAKNNFYMNGSKILWLVKNKKYTINEIVHSESCFKIKSEYSPTHKITNKHINDYFYVNRILRKNKLEKLMKNIK